MNVALNAAEHGGAYRRLGSDHRWVQLDSSCARSVPNDWFSQNMPDLDLQDLARADSRRDGSLTYDDMLDLFAEAESEGAVSGATLADRCKLWRQPVARCRG